MNVQGYEVRLFKNDILTSIQQVHNPDVLEMDFSALIAEEGAGSYTATVKALGDGKQWRDSIPSVTSDELVVA